MDVRSNMIRKHNHNLSLRLCVNTVILIRLFFTILMMIMKTRLDMRIVFIYQCIFTLYPDCENTFL